MWGSLCIKMVFIRGEGMRGGERGRKQEREHRSE